MEHWLDAWDAAELLYCARSTVLAYASAGRLRGSKVGRQWRFTLQDVEQFAEKRAMPTGQSPVKPEPPEPYMSVNQAAAYLALCSESVYRAAQSGRLKGKKFGRNWRFRRSWLDEFLADPFFAIPATRNTARGGKQALPCLRGPRRGPQGPDPEV
jgi:excisionase family DNA binding protein